MIIGFVGKQQHGKTTAANVLVSECGFRRHNFKDALIAEIKHKFPRVLEELVTLYNKHGFDGMSPWTIDKLFKDKPGVMRALLQNYGTEVRRAEDPDHWVDAWGQMASVLSEHDLVVDDVRFLNEAAALQGVGGKLIRIVRDDMANNDSHQSEVEQDAIIVDYEIHVNTGELDKLKEEVLKAVFVR